MSRSERLFELLQALRRHRRPVSGRILAEETGVSIRTLYRDIASLQGQGAQIEGEPGLGYVLRPGFLLPPLMFSRDEIEALVLGSRWVASRTDSGLSAAARDGMAKIAAVLPPELREELEGSSLLVGPGEKLTRISADVAALRAAIRAELKLVISYADGHGNHTSRTVWPFGLGYFDRVQVLLAWCELRQGFRHFRLDRVMALAPTTTKYPRRRPALLKEWRAIEGAVGQE